MIAILTAFGAGFTSCSTTGEVPFVALSAGSSAFGATTGFTGSAATGSLAGLLQQFPMASKCGKSQNTDDVWMQLVPVQF